jgi:hypothetical protein
MKAVVIMNNPAFQSMPDGLGGDAEQIPKILQVGSS